jgi:hypothetical protein
MKNGVFWDVTPCGSCNNRRTHFFAAYVGCQLQLVLFLVHRFLSPWWRRRQVPPTRRFLQEPHGVTTQKTSFFIVTAVKTSNLTDFHDVSHSSFPIPQANSMRVGVSWNVPWYLPSTPSQLITHGRPLIQRCITNTAEGHGIKMRWWMGLCPGPIRSLTAEYIPATHLQIQSVVFWELHNLNISGKTSGAELPQTFINVPEQSDPRKRASISDRHYARDASKPVFTFPVQEVLKSVNTLKIPNIIFIRNYIMDRTCRMHGRDESVKNFSR